MGFDMFSISLCTALVVVVAGVQFVLDTVLRRDTGAGRIWSLAFIAAILTTVTYLAWVASGEAGIAIAIGNAAFVVGTGCLWVGSRSYNGRALAVSAWIVAGAAIATFLAALLAGPDGGDWAGALVMFVSLAVLAALGSIESRRSGMGRSGSTIPLTLVLGVQAVFYVARSIVFVVVGPEDEFFVTWFGSVTTSFLTMILTIVAVVSMSVLRAGQSRLRGRGDSTTLLMDANGLYDDESFETLFSDLTRRAAAFSERIAVIAVRLDDLPQIATAFGSVEAQDIARAWHVGARRYAPTSAIVGHAGTTSVVVALQPSSIGDARRVASRIHRRLLDDFGTIGTSVVPVLGVGIAVSDIAGYDSDALLVAANDAAIRSASSPDASVMIAGAV
jgi:GGDEF domain-containing protein